MILYQFSNFFQIFYIIVFSILLLVGIAIIIGCLPLIKLIFQGGNPMKAKLLLAPIVIVLCLLGVSLLIFPVYNLSQYSSIIRDTDVEHCNIVTGEIEELETIPQYARGADLVSYHLKFKIEGSEFYIDTDVGVPLENIGLWNEGDCITVYYQDLEGKNSVIRVTKEP